MNGSIDHLPLMTPHAPLDLEESVRVDVERRDLRLQDLQDFSLNVIEVRDRNVRNRSDRFRMVL